MNAVFEPSLLFISDADWADEEKRDAFLQHLLDNLTIIDQYKIAILWSEELETLLWAAPQLHPWFGSDFKNAIISTIYTKLQQRTENISSSEKQCTVAPIITSGDREDVLNHFLSLVAALIELEENFYLSLGYVNTLHLDESYVFNIENFTPYIPKLIRKPLDWFAELIPLKYYPKSIETFESDLKLALKIVKYTSFLEKINSLNEEKKEDLMDYESDLFVYPYEFEKGFVKKLLAVEQNRHKDAIIEKITAKLMLNRTDSQYLILNDEKIKQKEEHRFYVTERPTSTRIHYILGEQNTIIFLQYYGEGEHDDGL